MLERFLIRVTKILVSQSNCNSMGGSGLQARIHKWNQIQEGNVVIMKRGQLLKQSKYLKGWRKRTVIVANGYIVSFNQDKLPTAIINIAQISNLSKQQEDSLFILSIQTKTDNPFLFKTNDQYEREQWFSLIKSQKIRLIKESNISASSNNLQVNKLAYVQVKEGKL